MAFAQTQPALVTLGHTVGVTASDGTVSVDYTAGSVVGCPRSRPPSAAAAPPVRTRWPFGGEAGGVRILLPLRADEPARLHHDAEYETTTCTVRLADRYGNRVGIATPVDFAAEAGAISASVLTKPFDFNNPTDPDEGSLTVTFSSDMGIGFSPADTTPLPADLTQFPKQRPVEPSSGSANPRDQLVTIIAMVRGEEAFVDANLDGQYNAGELFVDQGTRSSTPTTTTPTTRRPSPGSAAGRAAPATTARTASGTPIGPSGCRPGSFSRTWCVRS